MHMWMVIKIAGMGVEHGMGTSAALQLRVPAGKAIDRLPGGFEQEIIGNLLVGPEQSPQLSRYCEGNHKIVNLQQFGLLSFNPSLTFVVLATGAAAMAAGMG